MSQPMQTPSPRDLIAGNDADRNRRLLETGHFSDLTITCQDNIFHVHKAVLVGHGGDFFVRAICAGFAESVKHIIDLPDDDPEEVALMLQYIYSSDYPRHVSRKRKAVALSEPIVVGKEADDENDDWDDEDAWHDVDKEARLANCHLHVRLFAIACKFSIQALKDKARRSFMDEISSCWTLDWE